MAKMKIQINNEVEFKGFLEYVEGGVDSNVYGFHIAASNDDGQNSTVWITFDSKDECLQFIESLRKQLLSVGEAV